jgi:aminobenzoyl-glutamate utilization protein B
MIFLVALPAAFSTVVADDKDDVIGFVDSRYEVHDRLARAILDHAEVGYQETQSSALLIKTLRDANFEIQTAVAGIPTSFVASAGSGAPVIAYLAEFDALPGITQTADPFRNADTGKTAGHACGHHLFGTASVGAAIAVKRWLETSGTEGTIRVYGTPAEEGGSGKVYMVREGLFDDVDAVLSWHPDDVNDASPKATLANRSAKFRFKGVSAHAAVAPEKARSALDGVEAFNFMINMLREHVPQETRIHYVITNGGNAPNVVPDFAEVFYYVRYLNAAGLKKIWARVEDAARAAALGTGTKVEWEIIHGNHSVLPNTVLSRVADANLRRVGGVSYDADERRFAEEIYPTLIEPELELGTESDVQPLKFKQDMGSSDVGDVSWTVPTIDIDVATWVPGTAAHTWQAIASGSTSIGIKGMQVAAKMLALSAMDLYSDPQLLVEAKTEFDNARGNDFVYEALLGDRDPPLDYRK